MTIGQQRAEHKGAFKQRAFDTAYTILEASGLRYQSAQIDGLAVILAAYAQREIELAARGDKSLSEESHCPSCDAWPLRLYADGSWACDECGWGAKPAADPASLEDQPR